jgi:mRNA interferase MazF
MEKDFDAWNSEKILIERQSPSDIFFRERDIWWCRFGLNVGDEQDGKGLLFMRPILILKKFNRSLFWAVPLSLKMKDNFYYVSCIDMFETKRMAVISQLRLMSSKRLVDKVSVATEGSFESIRKAVKDLL